MDKTTRTQFDGRKALAHVEHLAVTIGSRLTGTPGEHKAAAYIEKTFKSFGLSTRRQKFPVQTFDSAKCRLAVQDGRKWRDVPIQPVGLSASTPAGGFTGEFYYAESGEPEYYSPEMAGKIVLVCGNIAPENRYKLLAHKPRAIIFIEGGISAEPARMNLRDEALEAFGKIPIGRMLHLDGVEIISKGLTTARLTMVNTRRASHCFNVIGELTGTDRPDEIVAICGHYDTSRAITGASDNAGGAALVMELARVLSAAGSRRTLRFVAFGGEETGLQGSKHYARELLKSDKRQRKNKTFNDKTDKTELSRHVLAFNMDVHGAVLAKGNFNYSGSEDLGAAVRLLAKELGVAIGAKRGPMSSDGSSLAAIGIPALQFARGGGTTAYLHSTLDDIRFVSAGGLEKAGRFSELLLKRHVTTAAAMAFPREIPDEQKADLEKYKVKVSRAAGKVRRAAGKRATTKAARKPARKAKRGAG